MKLNTDANEPDLHIEPELAALLETLRNMPPRNEVRAQQGRAAFLASAQALVSNRSAQHKPEWRTRPHSRRLAPVLRRTVAASSIGAALLFGGGAAVFAAQGASPTDPVYPIKVWSEDLRIALAGDDRRKLNLLVEFADRRTREWDQMAVEHHEPPPEFVSRFRDQVNQALYLLDHQEEPDGESLSPAARAALARAYEKVRLQTQHTPARPEIPAPGSLPLPEEDDDRPIGAPPTDPPEGSTGTPAPGPTASSPTQVPAQATPEAQATVILPPQAGEPRPPQPQPGAAATVVLPPAASEPRPPQPQPGAAATVILPPQAGGPRPPAATVPEPEPTRAPETPPIASPVPATPPVPAGPPTGIVVPTPPEAPPPELEPDLGPPPGIPPVDPEETPEPDSSSPPQLPGRP